MVNSGKIAMLDGGRLLADVAHNASTAEPPDRIMQVNVARCVEALTAAVSTHVHCTADPLCTVDNTSHTILLKVHGIAVHCRAP